jgi:hypothetical protein
MSVGLALGAGLGAGVAMADATLVDPLGSYPRIVNGAVTWQTPATAALLSGASANTASFTCSGTMIGCRTFLTAGHCVCPAPTSGIDDFEHCASAGYPRAARLHVFVQHAGLFAVESVVLHPGYGFPTSDLAVVTLAQPVEGVIPEALAPRAPLVGEAGTIAGFGRTSAQSGSIIDYNIKRLGQVTLAGCVGPDMEDQVCWTFNGTGANTCNGDSGGPLFLEFDGDRFLAGVTSGGESSSCLAVDHSHDVDVSRYTDWIASVAGEALGGRACGVAPRIGEDGAPVGEFYGTLVDADVFGEHSFVVPDDTRELVVTMNGRGAGADFDLYVRFGTPPNAEDFDCSVVAAGRNAVCRFEAPTPGTWYLRVVRASGTGEYQATATSYRAVPSCGDVDASGAIVANDALLALRAALGLGECATSVCDISGDGEVVATDALLLLQLAVGQPILRYCPLE